LLFTTARRRQGVELPGVAPPAVTAAYFLTHQAPSGLRGGPYGSFPLVRLDHGLQPGGAHPTRCGPPRCGCKRLGEVQVYTKRGKKRDCSEGTGLPPEDV